MLNFDNLTGMDMINMKKTVVELFAGVGGFRVGFNDVKLDKKGNTIENSTFEFVWANQWEPSTKSQDAFLCYEARFGKSDRHVNEDISTINKKQIPDHSILVGGFPCQDYSVARSLSKEKGIEGKKGVLWWQINEILEVKRPPFVLLENVDRLLKSPSKQRGRDFGIMLRCFNDLGYVVEWRVINAAEYGFAQKRRRVFIFAYHKSTNYYKHLHSKKTKQTNLDIIKETGLFAKTFPIIGSDVDKIIEDNINKVKYSDLVDVSNNFSLSFDNSGIMIDGIISTCRSKPIVKQFIPLRDILEKQVDSKYFILDERKFKELKGSKKILRKNDLGFEYYYSEGSMSYPDNLDQPARTMLTSESSVNRSTHVVSDLKTGLNRLITPIEAERINHFPDNWTHTGMSEKRRYFMMGNALVTAIPGVIGKYLSIIIENE